MQNIFETIEEEVGSHFNIQPGEILVAMGEQNLDLDSDTLIWDLLLRGLLSSEKDVLAAEKLVQTDPDTVLVRREIALKKKRQNNKRRQKKLNK